MLDDAAQTVQAQQFLTFQVAGEEYGIPILRVREILRYEGATRVPSTPPWVLGVLNLRGSVVPVVDLARKFGLPPSTIGARTCVVVVEVDLGAEQTLMGVIADAVSEVLDLSSQDVEPPPAFGTHVRIDYLAGMGRVGRRFVLLLDTDRVLSASELLAAGPGDADPAAPGPSTPTAGSAQAGTSDEEGASDVGGPECS